MENIAVEAQLFLMPCWFGVEATLSWLLGRFLTSYISCQEISSSELVRVRFENSDSLRELSVQWQASLASLEPCYFATACSLSFSQRSAP